LWDGGFDYTQDVLPCVSDNDATLGVGFIFCIRSIEYWHNMIFLEPLTKTT